MKNSDYLAIAKINMDFFHSDEELAAWIADILKGYAKASPEFKAELVAMFKEEGAL